MSNRMFVATTCTCLRAIAFVFLGLPLASPAAVQSGTGFFISSDGYIATNYHVVDGANNIAVRDSSGNLQRASVVLRDKANDLAVIKVSGGGFPTLPLRNSAEIKKGTAVFTLGFPNVTVQGRESKVTTGVISSVSGIKGEPNSFQISVPIQPGNSGGPLIDMTGAIVGLTTAKLNAAAMIQKGGALPENVNYAIKSNYLLELIGTDRNVDKRIARSTSQKTQPLTSLVEKAENAIVIIVAENASPDEARPQEKNSEVPRYARDAQANESFNRGRASYDRQDYKDAVVNFGKSAELGHAEAQYLLGSMYAEGRGVTKDDEEAVRWYRKAAEQGIMQAQRDLGQMYATARGIGRDYALAEMWYRKAADQGDVTAQLNLGLMYEMGVGVPKNENEAERWYRKAAVHGDQKAQKKLDNLIANRQRISDGLNRNRKAAEKPKDTTEIGPPSARVSCPNSQAVRAAIEYPREARKAGEQGKVVLELTITTGGSIKDVVVKSSTNAVFNDVAIAAVRQFECEKQSRAVRIQVPFTFSLVGK